jgi:hypothetical protein
MMHLPDVASWPGFVGSKQPRPYSFSDSGDLLTFSGKEFGPTGSRELFDYLEEDGSYAEAKPRG